MDNTNSHVNFITNPSKKSNSPSKLQTILANNSSEKDGLLKDFDALVHANTIAPEQLPEIEDVQAHLDSIAHAYLKLLLSNHDAEDRIRAEFSECLKAKDIMIARLLAEKQKADAEFQKVKEKYFVLQNGLIKPQEELQTDRDKFNQALTDTVKQCGDQLEQLENLERNFPQRDSEIESALILQHQKELAEELYDNFSRPKADNERVTQH